MSFFSLDSKFSQIMGRVFDLMMLNIIFLIMCIPIVTIGANFTAMYYVTLKMIKNEETYIFRTYWKSFRENFKQATGNSFTGDVRKAGYTKKMAANMIMPNGLFAYSCKMSGAELKETVRNFVEGYEGGFIPFNRGSLPVVSGISAEIRETEDGYTLSKVTKDGKEVRDQDTFTVTCLAIPQHMEAYPAEDHLVFDGGDTSVKDTWTEYVSDGNAVLAEPENYMTLR